MLTYIPCERTVHILFFVPFYKCSLTHEIHKNLSTECILAYTVCTSSHQLGGYFYCYNNLDNAQYRDAEVTSSSCLVPRLSTACTRQSHRKLGGASEQGSSSGSTLTIDTHHRIQRHLNGSLVSHFPL